LSASTPASSAAAGARLAAARANNMRDECLVVITGAVFHHRLLVCKARDAV
jgi:hypothetical protein